MASLTCVEPRVATFSIAGYAYFTWAIALFFIYLSPQALAPSVCCACVRTASGENLSAATLCYVWDQKLADGTELPNAFTSRIHYLVLHSASARLQQWVGHTRDLRADFLRSFGTESSTVPTLLAILVGADADDTARSSLAYVGDVSLMEQ